MGNKNRQIDIGRQFLGLLQRMDQEDRRMHIEKAGGVSSVGEYGELDLKHFLCHAASRSTPVRMAQVRFINDIFQTDMSGFEVTRIGLLWDGTPAAELVRRRVPDAFAAQVVRDTFVSAANADVPRYLSETWITVYRDLGEAMASMSSCPEAVMAYVNERVRSMEQYLDRHGRPYLRCAQAKEERRPPSRKELEVMFANPGVTADQAFFLDAHELESQHGMFRLVRELLFLADGAAREENLLAPGFPLGVLPHFMADAGCLLCALASRDGGFSLDQIRLLRLLLGADLSFAEIGRIGADMARTLPDTRLRVLEGVSWLGQNLSGLAMRWFLCEIGMCVVTSLARAGSALLALGPDTSPDTRQLFESCMLRLACQAAETV